MATQTRLDTGSTPDLSGLEKLFRRDWYPDNRPQYDPIAEGRKIIEQNRTGGFTPPKATGNYYTVPDQSPAYRQQTTGPGQPLSKLKTIADYVAEQQQASSPQSHPSLSSRLSGRRSTSPPVAPEVRPVQTNSNPSGQAPNLSARLAGRSGGTPSAPIPSPAPILNPQNLTRAVGNHPLQNLSQSLNRSIAPAGRALAPLANRLTPAARVLGSTYRAIAPAIPYIAAGLDFAGGLQAGESVGRAGAGALGGLAGALAGAQAGAALGTLILPGIGTIAGGIIGGAIGGFGGGWLADRLHDTLFPNDALPAFDQPIQRGPAPPFTGGQSAGVRYRVTVTRRVPGSADNTHYRDVWGKIYSIGVDTGRDVNGVAYGTIHVYAALSSSNQTATYHPIVGGSGTDAFLQTQIVSQSVVRVDGQPDTGGNPAAQPGAPNQLPTAPIVPTAPTVAPSRTLAPSSPTNPTNLSPGTPTDPFTPQSPVVPSNPLAPSAPPTPTTTPTLAPPADAQQGNTPIWNPIGALPFGIPAIIPAAMGGRGSYPQLWRPPSITSSITTGGGAGTTSPNPVCRFIADPHTPAINGRTQQMEIVQLAIQAYQTQMLTQVDTKLGPQVNGGLSGYLKNFWKWFHVDRIMNLLTFWVTIHNAMMLSNNIGQTLFGAFDIVFEIFGNQLKDDDGADISTSEWVGDQIDNALKSVFGDQNVETVKGVWTRANRIYQATANIANAVQSMMYSITEGLEAVGKYVALIGNAAKRFGVVSEGSYSWMNTNPNFRTNKFFKILDGLQEGAEAIEVVAGETQNIIEMKDEILTQKDELKGLIQEGEDGKKEEEDDSKKESVYPAAAAIKESNLVKPEE